METQISSPRRGTKFPPPLPRHRGEDIDCCTATDEAARPGILSPALKKYYVGI